MTATGSLADEVIWHEVECGSYTADLPLWRQLVEAAPGRILELGCGTGRVALDLARRGHRVTGIDHDPALVAELDRRAGAEKLDLVAREADASHLSLGERFGLILAPMQLIQLLTDDRARAACLRASAAHLAPGGTLALAMVEAGDAAAAPAQATPSPPLPDVRERDGWVFSSLPLGVFADGGWLVVERLRQTVSPAGRLEEVRSSVRLRELSALRLETEGRAAGLSPAGRRKIDPTASHVGSTVVLLGA
jgi:SAM-dependent methyltransferase